MPEDFASKLANIDGPHGFDDFQRKLLKKDELAAAPKIDPVEEKASKELGRLATFILQKFPQDVGEGSAVDIAIKLLNELSSKRDATILVPVEAMNAKES